MHLGPLDQTASRAIIASVVHADQVSNALAASVHARTGGNPFFIEEICRSLLEEGGIQVNDGQAALENSVRELPLPPTVQAVLRARIDRAGDVEKTVLRHASVVGREFPRRILDHILGDRIDIASALDRLRSLGLVQRIQLLPEARYQFRHVLTQEVAHDTLVVHQRKAIHGMVAAAIEALYGARLEDHLDVLAHHWSEAEEWRKAVDYARRMAKRADALGQFREARRSLEEAERWLLAWPESAERRSLLIEILLEQERAGEKLGEPQQQRKVIARLLGLLENSSSTADIATLARVQLRQADLCALVQRFEEAESALLRCRALVLELDDRKIDRESLNSLGFLRWQEGRYPEALDFSEQALAIARELGDLAAQGRDLQNLAILLRYLHRHASALSRIDEAFEIYAKLRDPESQGGCLFTKGTIYRDLGDTDEAYACYERSQNIYTPAGNAHRGMGLTDRALICLERGQVEQSLELYRKAVAAARKSGYAQGLSQSLDGLAKVLVGLDRCDEASAALDEATLLFRRLGDRTSEAASLTFNAEILERGGAEASAKAKEFLLLALELRRGTGDQRSQVKILEALGRIGRRTVEDRTCVVARYREAATIAAQIGDRAKAAQLLNSLGIVDVEGGDYEAALCTFHQALEIFRDVGEAANEGLMLNSIGFCLKRLQRSDAAIAILLEAVEHNRRNGSRLLLAHSLASLAELREEAGDIDAACQHYEESLDLRRELGDRRGEAWMLLHVARVHDALGTPGTGARCEQVARLAAECDDPDLMKALDSFERR